MRTQLVASEYKSFGDTLIYPSDLNNGSIASIRVNSDSDTYDSLVSSAGSDFKQNCIDSASFLENRAGVSLGSLKTSAHILRSAGSYSVVDGERSDTTYTAVVTCRLSVAEDDNILSRVYIGKKGLNRAKKNAQQLYRDPSVVAVVLKRSRGMGLVNGLIRSKVHVLRKR